MAALQEWFTVKDLVGIPGMPTTERGVQLWGKKNLTGSRSKKRGKGLEYSRDSLPAETQEYLDAQDRQAVLQQLLPAPEPTPAAPPAPATALATRPQTPPPRALATPAAAPAEPDTTAEQRQRQLARLLVLRTLRQLQDVEGCSTRQAALLLLQHARAGQLAPALVSKLREACDERGAGGKAAADGLPSRVTLQRWDRAEREGRSLAPRASAELSLAVRPWHRAFFALTDRPQKPTLKQCHEQLLASWRPEWADTAGAPPPSYDMARREYEKRSQTDRLKGRHTGSALRSRTFYRHRTYAGLAPFTEVHSDGWTSHFTAPHPVTGQYVTYEIWHFHDVATRYVTPMAVGTTENTDVILQGLQNCIRVGGVMAVWQTDHTSSVKSQRVMEEHSGLADRLGISVVHPAEVGNSQANGMAENFNTWLDRQARELATYQHPHRMDSGTFTRVRRITNAMVRAASQPAERAALRAKAMKLGKGLVFDSHAQALDWIAQLEARWNNHPSRSLPKLRCPATGRLVHMTPRQSLDAAIAAGWEPMRLPETVLVDQFRPHLRKKVTRGTVTPYSGMRYHHADLAHHEGEEVLVAVDRDQPAHVWVKDLQGRVLAVAHFVEAVGPRTESMAEHSERKRAEAQIRLREQQIEQIEQRLAPPALDMAAPAFELGRELPPLPERALRPVEPKEVPLRPVTREPRPLTYLESLEKIEEMEAAARAARPPGAPEVRRGTWRDDEPPLRDFLGDLDDDEDDLKRVAAG